VPDPVTAAASPRTGRAAAPALLLVGAAYLAVQLGLFHLDRPPSWDEAIYLSQVTPGTPALPFAPSRARGITVLVAPVSLAGGSATAVRLFLVVASAVALGASFRQWIRSVGVPSSAAAAAIFGFTWVSLFYGSEVMPNLWAAFLAVAATGAFVRRLDGKERQGAMAAGVLVFLMTLMRPPDGLVLVLALAAFVLVARRHALAGLVPLCAGLALGWAVWLVEMSARYGGPAAAIRRAGKLGHVTAGGIGERLLQNLALTDGPTIGPESHPHVPPAGVLWWVAIVLLSGIALFRTRGTTMFTRVVCTAFVGAALAAEYLVLVAGLAPRFLLPAYAVLSIPAAAGLVSLLRDDGLRRAVGLGALVVLAALGVWQLGTARSIAGDVTASRATFQEAGEAVRSLARGRPCLVGSEGGFPEVAFAARCAGRELHGSDTSSIADLAAAARGSQVFVVLRAPPGPGSPLPGSPARTVHASDGVTWLIYALPHQPV
jgi:hypothetical protein